MYSRGAVYYDRLNEDLQSDDIIFYKQIISPEVKNICELACGTGRILYSLAEDGRLLTGIDLSQEMLEVAKLKKSQLGIEAELICDDMCRLKNHGMFSVVICGYNSVQHICEGSDINGFFRGVKNLLEKDGIFILDLFNPNEKFLFVKGNERILTEFFTDKNEKISIVEYTKYNPETQINYIDYKYYKNDSFLFEESYKMRQFNPKELDELIVAHGYEIKKKYGSYQKDDFVCTSPKQIYILTLKK